MKKFKVEIKGKQPEIIDVHDYDAPEAWLRDQPKNVTLNNTSYPKADIVAVTEVKSRKGLTNMEGV